MKYYNSHNIHNQLCCNIFFCIELISKLSFWFSIMKKRILKLSRSLSYDVNYVEELEFSIIKKCILKLDQSSSHTVNDVKELEFSIIKNAF